MTAEVKMRTLAQQDDVLLSFFRSDSNGTFRWFDRQLQPGYITQGTCVRVRRVGTVRQYAHETRTRRSVSDMAQPRFQLDVMDYDPERARSAAAAISDWLATVDFSSDAQFASPRTSPTRHPNFVLNQRAGMEPELQPPVYVETLDIRIFDQEQ